MTIEYRWAEGHYDRLPALAAEFVARKVNLILATGGNLAALEAKNATSTIPIVFVTGGDPVAEATRRSGSRATSAPCSRNCRSICSNFLS